MAAEPHMVFLGFGKYARSDRIYALEPITRRRTRRRSPHPRSGSKGVTEPIVASRTERTILDDMGQDAASQAPSSTRRSISPSDLVAAVDAGRVDLGDLGRRARHLVEHRLAASGAGGRGSERLF